MAAYYKYSEFLKKHFNAPVRKIGVDAGFSCPNRDGTLGSKGCVYCSNDAFSPARRNGPESIREQVLTGISRMERQDSREKYIVYFQPFTNTYKPAAELEKIYQQAFCHPDVVGIAVGTRPDCLDAEKAALLKALAEKTYVSVEIGVQSVNEESLRWMNRGHSFAAVEEAVALFQGGKAELCFHLILGFAWEGRKAGVQAARALACLPYHSIKLHNLHVCRGTPLEKDYWARKVPLPALRDYVSMAADFLEHTPATVSVQRLIGDAPPEHLVAPDWCLNKAGAVREIEEELERRKSVQGIKTACPLKESS
jgi:radical SAM protein (TIGR01212 family)